MKEWHAERVEEPKGIGCVIVNCETPDMTVNAVKSIVNHVDCLVIIDNSKKLHPKIARLESSKVSVIHTKKNITHGPGLNMGISFLRTEYIICMDSDAVLKDRTLIPEMKSMLTEGVYGVGNIETIIDDIEYLHPYFCMFRKRTFTDNPPFIQHGAPFARTMIAIKGKLKVLQVRNILDRCHHIEKVTRSLLGRGWIKQKWESHL